ncbi:MAG: hypothetical protein QXG76_02160 [Candidatus Bathyarchaeia archaeon]
MKILGEKPTVAFALSLVGAILIIIQSVLVLVYAIFLSMVGGFIGQFAGMVPGMEGVSGAIGAFFLMFLIICIVGLVFGILVLVGALMINSGEKDKVRKGSIMVLIFSILSLFTASGFYIGFILALIGGILGLIWKPEARVEAPPPPPPV